MMQRQHCRGRRWPLTIALAVTFLLLIPTAQAQSPTPTRVSPLPNVPQTDPFFGAVQAVSAPDQAAAAGVTWERLVFSWKAMQPYHPHDVLVDQAFPPDMVMAERARGFDVVGVILDTPAWAAADHHQGARAVPKGLDKPWNDPENVWGNFVHRLAGLYKGAVDTWIVWNEPDVYDSAGHAFWDGTPAEYARLLKVAWQAAKDANPKARIYLAGMAYWFDKENGRPLFIRGVLDVLARDPEAPASGWFFDGIVVHTYGSPLNAFAVPILFRQTLAAYGLEKPIWIGEANVVPFDDPAGPLERTAQRASLEEQAAWVIQATALARAAGVERFEVYKMRDEGADNGIHWGLVRDDRSARPAYVAYQVAARELGGTTDATFYWGDSAFPPTSDQVQAVVKSNDGRWQYLWPTALNAVRMRRGTSLVTVAWNGGPEPLSAFIPAAGDAARALDKYGRDVPLAPVAGGFTVDLRPATHNTDTRDRSVYLIGGDPLIVIQNGVTAEVPPLRAVDACFGAPGLDARGWTAPTGYHVAGPWLDFYRDNGGLDVFGYPRSPIEVDPLNEKQCVQYFQRAILEWHPDNKPPFRLQRRLLGELLTGPADPPVEPSGRNGPDYWYFPAGPNGLGHAVSNSAPDGTRTGFKAFFDKRGREATFGYPMEEPRQRDGLWTQRFQAAILEYHPEFDRDGIKPGTGLPWRTWSVQLRLLGDQYAEKHQLSPGTD